MGTNILGNEDYRRREYEMMSNIQEISSIGAKHVAEIKICNCSLWNALKLWNYKHRDMSPYLSCTISN